jgi:HEAT repeat protein
MLQLRKNQNLQEANQITDITSLPVAVEVQTDYNITNLVAKLSPDTPWGVRKDAAQMLGYTRSQEALPGLLAALPDDPFWMVRCAIIQALITIGDSNAIPTLQNVARNDDFETVRSYAAKAIKALS